VPANNPYNPFGVTLQQSGFPLNAEPEFGPWVTDTVVRTLRNTAGLTVQLPHAWFVDASFTYGESDGTIVVNNSINRIKLQEALNGTLPGFEGQFFNPFNDESVSSPNKEFLDALRTQQILNSRTWQLYHCRLANLLYAGRRTDSAHTSARVFEGGQETHR
jgi:hypothetical protein